MYSENQSLCRNLLIKAKPAMRNSLVVDLASGPSQTDLIKLKCSFMLIKVRTSNVV